MPETVIRRANDADRPVLERLWLMFSHDMSEFDGTLPRPDGTFRSDRLQAAFTDPGWAPYLLISGDQPAGLSCVRGLTSSKHVRLPGPGALAATGPRIGRWRGRHT